MRGGNVNQEIGCTGDGRDDEVNWEVMRSPPPLGWKDIRGMWEPCDRGYLVGVGTVVGLLRVMTEKPLQWCHQVREKGRECHGFSPPPTFQSPMGPSIGQPRQNPNKVDQWKDGEWIWKPKGPRLAHYIIAINTREAFLFPSLQMQILRLRKIKLMVRMFIAGEVAEVGIESRPAWYKSPCPSTVQWGFWTQS